MQPDLEVDVVEVPYLKGDRFVLCSDGIHGSMPEKELLKMVANKKTALGAVIDDIATYVDNMGRSNGGGHDNLTLAIVETKINSKLRITMSKQIKYAFVILAVVCAISLVGNIWQATSSGPSESVPTDSTELHAKQDTIKRQAAEIVNLKHSVDSLTKH
jgi:protein phosphatase